MGRVSFSRVAGVPWRVAGLLSPGGSVLLSSRSSREIRRPALAAGRAKSVVGLFERRPPAEGRRSDRL